MKASDGRGTEALCAAPCCAADRPGPALNMPGCLPMCSSTVNVTTTHPPTNARTHFPFPPPPPLQQVAAENNTAGATYPDQSLYPVNSVPVLVKRINNVRAFPHSCASACWVGCIKVEKLRGLAPPWPAALRPVLGKPPAHLM